MNNTSVKLGAVIGDFAGIIQLIGGESVGFVRNLIIIPFLGILLAIILYRKVKDDYISEVVVGGVSGLIVIILFDFFSFTTGRLGVIQFRNFISMINFEFQFIIASILTAVSLIFIGFLSQIRGKEKIELNLLHVSAFLGGFLGIFIGIYPLLGIPYPIFLVRLIAFFTPNTYRVFEILPFFTGVIQVAIFFALNKMRITVANGILIGLITWSVELVGIIFLEVLIMGGANFYILFWHILAIIQNGLQQTVLTAVITAISLNIFLITFEKIRMRFF